MIGCLSVNLRIRYTGVFVPSAFMVKNNFDGYSNLANNVTSIFEEIRQDALFEMELLSENHSQNSIIQIGKCDHLPRPFSMMR